MIYRCGNGDCGYISEEAAVRCPSCGGVLAACAEDALSAMGETLGGITVQTQTLPPGSAATATLSGNVLTLGIPRGADGPKGETGDTGPADITLSFSCGVLTITPK